MARKTTTVEASPREETEQLILGMRRDRMGYTAIAERLNRDGVQPFGRGKAWYAATVRNVVMTCDPHAAELAAKIVSRGEGRVTEYECGLCGKVSAGDTMIHSSHTGARYCGEDVNGCRDRYERIKKDRKAAERLAAELNPDEQEDDA